MTLWAGLLLIFFAVVASIYVLVKLAPHLGLLAVPGEHRMHREPTPMVGGIAIYLGILLGFVLLDSSFGRILPSLFLLCIVGALDDRYSLPSWARFLAQGVAVYLIILLTGIQLESLGELVSPGHNLLLGKWAVPMTIFAAIGVINAINMSDGLDGLAGSLAVVVLLALLLVGSIFSGLILITLVSLAGFLCWNLRVFRPRATVFMGDAGSTMLGLLIAYLLIIQSQVPGGIFPVTALWIVALPLIDAVAVLLIRPLRGSSPFSADRIHYHHLLLDRGLSVNATLITILLVQSVLIISGIAMWRYAVPENIQLLGFLMLFGLYFFFLLRITRTSQN